MIQRILFVSSEEGLIYWIPHIERLKKMGWGVKKLPWYDEQIRDINIARVIEASQKTLIAVLDLEGLTQEQASEVLSQMKKDGTRIIVVSYQPNTIETADEAVQLPSTFADTIIRVPFSIHKFVEVVRRFVYPGH